ncbi:hypothetical protein V1227_19360 [Lentzea sp. DG1S-22]|uniref:hypothetical protein n=1 Tax=Lentzea sp. DG1S-22 TaxID=3108822 RepID=UPI002E77BAF6|nr:hypothetical protein [Lentzea sp. DG1S-22]WVH77293.1 hypothetical protein V1227_19360 [Lentzea sp. DG1S-22]
MPRIVKNLAVFASAAAFALTGAVQPSAAAAGGEPVTSTELKPKFHSVVGAWKGTVQHQGGSGPISLNFASSGSVCLRSGDGEHGYGEGTGTWVSTGTNSVKFTVREYLYDNAGNPTGSVDVRQAGSISGNTLSTSGMSTIYDVSGNFIATAPASITVARI